MVKNEVKYVTSDDVELMRKQARKTRYSLRNEMMIVMMYRHGLRVSELCEMRIDDLSLAEAKLFVRRLKGSNSMTHPIAGDELRLIRRFLKWRGKRIGNRLPWLFINERGNQFGRQSVGYMVKSVAKDAGIGPVSPHALRHGCGYYLANDKKADIRVIQDYLGHKNIQNTVLYTRLAGHQFEGLW